MEPIGYQDGITAFNNWFRAFGKWSEAFEKWATLPNEQRAITKPPVPPQILARGPNYDRNDITTWPWPDKHERTERKLKDWHDSSIPANPDPKPPTIDPHYGIAPRTYNYAVENNSDPLFCKVSPGVTVNTDGSFSDKYSRYDSNGKDIDGLRERERMVDGLNKSNNTNGLDPCTLYNGLTKWPDESYLR